MMVKELREGMTVEIDGHSHKITMIYRGGRGTYALVVEGGEVFIFRGSHKI